MKHLLLIICLATVISVHGQIGGRYAFTGAALPSNARATALGGSVINILDEDVALAQLNPAVIDSVMHNQLSLNHNFHLAGISNGNLAYGRYLDRWGIAAHAALQYYNFGNFTLADEFGNINGEFSAGEVGLTAGVGKQVNERIRAGINVKLLSGSYESYNSLGVGVDLGLHYTKNERTSWAIVLRNIGGELSPIVDDKRSLPLDLQIGYSKRLAHLPFRFSIIGHHLHEPYIRFDDPDFDISTDISGNQVSTSSLSRNIDNLFRHLYFSGEFLIGKNEGLRLRFGYDHLRRQELKLSTFQSMGGFSLGFGFNVKRIKIDYGRGIYHLAGAVNHLSFRYDIGKIFNKI
jgi:hypothetical protein